ncbi:unnamed protein product [Calypogeia fissa]
MDIIRAINQAAGPFSNQSPSPIPNQPSGPSPKKARRCTVQNNKIQLIEKLEQDSLNSDTGLVDLSASLTQQLLVQLLVHGNPKAHIELFELTQQTDPKVDESDIEEIIKPDVDVWKQILGDKQRMELLTNLLEAIEVASKSGPLDKLFDAQFQMGSIFDEVGDLEKSTFYYSNALTIAKQINDYTYEAKVKLHLGKVYKKMNAHMQAIQCFEDYMSIARSSNDIQGMIYASQDLLEVYGRCGEIADQENKLTTSIEFYEKCIEVANIGRNERAAAEARHKLGLLHYRLQHPLIALEFQTAYLAYCNEVNDNLGKTKGHAAAAQVFNALGKPDGEIHHLESNLQVSKLLDKRTEANAYCKLGIAYTEQNQLEYATTYFERYYKLAVELQDPEMLAWAAINIGLTRAPSIL